MATHAETTATGGLERSLSRRRLLSGSVAGLTGLLAARWTPPVAAQNAPQTQPWGDTFVGAASEDPYTLFGIVTDGSRVFAYLCADQPISGRLASYEQVPTGGDWFHGANLDPASIQLTAPSGSVLQLDLSGLAPVATVFTPTGVQLDIPTDLASGTAGIYRDQKKDNRGNTYTAGWIVFPNGLQSGAIQTVDQSSLTAPALDPNNPTLALTLANLNITFNPTPLALLAPPIM